jgi:hypothetical protein
MSAAFIYKGRCDLTYLAPPYEDHTSPRKTQYHTSMRGVDKGSHLLITDDQNRVLAGRGVSDSSVVKDECLTYASKHEFRSGKCMNMLLLYRVSNTCMGMNQRTSLSEGTSWMEETRVSIESMEERPL